MSQKAKDIAIIIGEVGLLAALAGLFVLAYVGKIDGAGLSDQILPVVSAVVAAVLAYLFRGQLATQQIRTVETQAQAKVEMAQARAEVLSTENQQWQAAYAQATQQERPTTSFPQTPARPMTLPHPK